MSSQYPTLGDRPIDQWKVTELKEELRRRKLTIKGLKEDLVRRLSDSIASETESRQEDELEKGSKPLPILKDTQDVGNGRPDLDRNGDELESREAMNKEMGKHSAMIDDNNGHTDIHMIDQANGESFVVGHREKQEDGNVLKVAHNAAGQEPKVPMEEPPSFNEHMIGSETMIHPEIIVQSDNAKCSPSQAESSIKDSFYDHKTDSFPYTHEDASDLCKPNGQLPEANQLFTRSSSTTLLEHKNQESIHSEPGNISNTPPKGIDVQVERTNQVSEAKSDLGFQVNTELISSDSLSISRKNELEDNLNANDFHLDLKVIQPEVSHSASGVVAPVDGDLLILDRASEPGLHLGSAEDIDVTLDSNDENLVDRVDVMDVGSPENLNLDRSSGDESMEEDIVGNRQIEFKTKADEGGHDDFVRKLHEIASNLGAGASQPSLGGGVIQEEFEPNTNADKRKHEAVGTVRANEPFKRQRRWNSEPLSAPERLPSNFTLSSTSKASVPAPMKRSDSVVSGDSPKERIVPPSQKSPTNSLRIDRFLRPFTLKSVQELLAKTGKVCSFWMDNIKTHCYVTFSTVEEAIATRNAVYNLQWPSNGGHLLIAEFVDPQEVKLRAEAPSESPALVTPTLRTPVAALQTQSSQQPARQHGVEQQLPPPPPPIWEQRQQLLFPQKKPEPPKPEQPILTLDDLFLKTKAMPWIYYLPLSEEQVAVKRAVRA